jgi:tetratricopeptide (TPR) repeat protein
MVPSYSTDYNRGVSTRNAIVAIWFVFVAVSCGNGGAPAATLAPAWAALEAGSADEARTLALQAAEAGVSSPADLASLVELLVRTGEAPRAVSVYRGFKGDPGPEAGDAYILALLSLGRLDDAEAGIVKRRKAGTMTARTQQMRGRLAMGRGRADDARRALLEAQRRDENDPETWALLGRVFLAEGNVPRAEGLLREAWRRFPDSLPVRKALSEVLLARGQQDDAVLKELVELLKPVAGRRPHDLKSRRVLGIALLRLERHRAARQVFEDLAEGPGAKPDDWQNLGAALAGQEEWREAIAAFERAAQQKPEDPRIFLNLGNALLSHARLAMEPLPLIDRAEEAFERARELDANNPIALVGLGRSAVKRNPADDPQALHAVKYFEDAIKLDPRCFEAHLQLALLYYDVWMPAEKERSEGYWRAKRAFEAAAALRPPATWTPSARQAYENLQDD